MDRNTILGFVLIAAILIGWSYLTAPSKEEMEEMRRKQDSIRIARTIEDSILITQENVIANENNVIADSNYTVPTKNDSLIIADAGIFTNSSLGQEKLFRLENEKLIIDFSNKGGRILNVELKGYKRYAGGQLTLFEGEGNDFNLSFFANNRTVNTENLYFEQSILSQAASNDTNFIIAGEQEVSVSYKLFPDRDISDTTEKSRNSYVEFLYTLTGNSYLLSYDINFVGMQNIIAANTSYINFDWSNHAPGQEKSIKNERAASTIYYKYLVDDVDYISERKDGKQNLNNKLKWIALKQQFFSAIIVAENEFLNAEVETQTDDENEDIVKYMRSSIGLPFENAQQYNIGLFFYFGPNHFNTLKAYDLSFEKLIPLGWGIFSWINRFAVIPVFNFLDSFNLNYGIIILILTILIKILLFPIAYKTYSSSAKMRILKPDIEEINTKFPKKEDALKKQQAVMGLYKKAGVNPMAGCLPMLLQLPILIAMFRFFPASIELRQEAFLWADDLSTYDSILDLPFNIPFYGSHVSLFTLLMTISTIIYTKINTEMMGSSNQMPGMKTMMYFMPIMFLGIFNNFASALSYYYFLTNIITFLQMYIFRFIVNEEALKKKIEANKNRKITTKKSGFQKRLEEMAKKQSNKQKK